MGCVPSKSKSDENIGEVLVFIPGFRAPKSIDFTLIVSDRLPQQAVDHLSALRTRVEVVAGQKEAIATRGRRRSAVKNGRLSITELHHALEEYLPALLGLASAEIHLSDHGQFVWWNQEDRSEETGMKSVWYEILSVLHLTAMVTLSRANALLLSKPMKGYLDCAVRHVLPQLPETLRRGLPVDLAEGNLRSLTLQSLGQCVEIQLGMAIDSAKATLAVKRRLACEMADENLVNLDLANGWGEKHRKYINWKHTEAKVAAYYFHGLILEENEEMAVASLDAAAYFMKESKRACQMFHATPPHSTNPSLLGAIKYVFDRVSKDSATNKGSYVSRKIIPNLPDFALALNPDEYQLPWPS